MPGESTLCASYLLSDGCGEWINLDAIRKMAIIRMDGKIGNPGWFTFLPFAAAVLFATRNGVCSSWLDEGSGSW
jgi:hypothetical protein